VRATGQEASRHGHDVSPVPARQPDSRPVLPRLRRPPRARLRRLWRRTTRGRPLLLQCGQAVAGSAAAPVRSPTPETYTPRHLAEKILTSKAALEGERKQVTVLFADLKGSMELLADRDPEEARKLLDPVLERMMEAVHRYEGTVNQVMGDGIMALLGAPVAHEDHAVRACYAALDLQAAIRRYAEEVRRSHGVVLQVRVGLNSGEVVVRAIGSDLRMDYTAVGQTTHLAARMEQLAKPDTTLLTADVLRLAEGFVAVTPLGPMPVKGLAAPVEVYELTGAGPRRSRLAAAAAGGLSRFVGRDAEFEQLRQALSRAATGHGQVVALVGEAGAGKSRLVWEVTHSHRTHGWLIVQTSSVSYGGATPYLPLVELLKTYCQIEPHDDARKVREKLTGKLLALDPALQPTLTALLALLDVPVEQPEWQTLEPPQRRDRTLDAMRRLLLRQSQAQPLLVVFEDLHWIDAQTQAFLDRLVESLPAARLVLLVNYRPEYQHGWGGKTYYTQIRLDPLPLDTAEALLLALLGDDRSVSPLTTLLFERTEGNPFFLEESVRALVETGALVGERGSYRLTAPLTLVEVPVTVQAILTARIDRLPADDKRLLQAAAVIGYEVPFTLLQDVAGLPDDQLRQGLTHLQAAEFLYESRLLPDLAYTFKHALTHDAAYRALLHERRRALHGEVLAAIERRGGTWRTEVEIQAYHAVQAEIWDRAVDALREAASVTYARGAIAASVERIEQAIELLPRLPASADNTRRAIDVRLSCTPLLARGQIARFGALLREAEQLARDLDDQVRLIQALRRLGGVLILDGRYAQAAESEEEVLGLATRLGDVESQLGAANLLGQAQGALGRYREAIARLLPIADGADAEGARTVLAGSVPVHAATCAWLGWFHAVIGQFDQARRYVDRGVQWTEAFSHPAAKVTVGNFRALVDIYQGRFDAAISALERTLREAEAHGLSTQLHVASSFLGSALAGAGRAAEGLPHLARGVSLQEEIGTRIYLARRYMQWAEGLLLAGQPQDARRAADTALSLARATGERGTEAETLRVLGAIAAAGGSPDLEVAATCYHRGLALACELGMRPLLAHCHLGLGELYRRTGDRVKSQEHLTTAAPMCREMDMGFWLEKAEAALAGGAP
jgi:class 3 adenylate cyclase/tetratricopeptide (TPR) repeat protein